MPVNTTRVVGEIRLPQDVVPERSVVHFKITGFDTDAVDNVVIAPRKPQTAQIQNDGTIDINLWPNDDGTRSTLYNVELEIYNGNSPYIVPLGQIEVPQTAGPHDLTDLLPVQPPTGTPLEEYLAQLQAAISSTEAAAVRAETAAQSINALDVQDDGTSVATPVIRINARAGLTATQDGTDPNLVHLDATGGGGGLPQYFSTSAVRTAITDGTLADGARFFLYDEPMIVDRSLDNNPASWLYNTNGDANLGVRTLSNLPFNYSVFPGFKTQDNNFLFLHTSPDNVRFYRVNKYPMIRGGGDSNIGGRDSQLFWNENLGEWWMPVTSGVAITNRDFAVFRSKDLITWGLSDGFLDANSPEGKVRGKTLPGTSRPVDRQWSNKFYRFNGTLYIITSLQVLPDTTNAFGNNALQFRPYIAEVIDEDAMTFGPVSPLQIGGSTEAKLNPDIILVDGVYYASIKNSPDRTVEVWSTTDLFGVWTLRTTIDIDPGNLDSLEGNTWAVHKYIDPNDPGNVLVKYRLHLANNRDENDELIGIPRFTESLTNPFGPFGPIEQLDFSYASRNGTITNTAMVNDPRAMRTLMAAEAAFGGEKRDDIDDAEQLSAGTHDLYPQQDFEYYILGEAGSTTVTIREHVADRFFLAVHNTNPNATITVVGDSLSRPFTVGGGNQELIEVRWSEQINRYIPVGRFGTGGGAADGVVTAASFSNSTRTLTLERSESLPDLTATIPSENEPIVIGVAGQSNAVGSLQATDGDKTIWPGTFAWNGTTTADGTAFAPYVFGTYPLNRGTSPNFANNIGLQAANLLKQATGRDVYVIQLAEGGRRIEPFIQPATRTANGWTNLGGADIAPFFYDQLVDAIAAVPGRTTMRLDQFIWQQGENNQTDTQAEYQAKLQALRSDLIAANVIDASHGSFTIGGLVPDHPYYATHRAAAEAVEAAFSDVVYINSNNLPDVGDNVHFTGDALDGLSSRHICQGNLVSGLFNQPFTKASGQNTFMLSDNGFRVLRRNRAGALTPYSVDQPDNILGNISDPFHGLTLQATDDSGDQFSSGSRDRTLILDQFQNMILANTGQIGNNNRGLDVSGGARTNQLTQTSGTYTWNPDDGSVVNFASSLTGTLTIDISNLLAQKWVSVYVSNPNGQTINFTLPSGIGSVDWAQPGPVTVGNNRLNYFFHRIGGSSIAGISTEYGA